MGIMYIVQKAPSYIAHNAIHSEKCTGDLQPLDLIVNKQVKSLNHFLLNISLYVNVQHPLLY